MGEHISIIIPAAGSATRMRGEDKLLRPVAGRPLLRQVAERAHAVSQDVTVMLPSYDHPRAHILQGLAVRLLDVPDRHMGMSSAIRRGVGMLSPNSKGVMILPADMPDLQEADLQMMSDAYLSAPRAMLHQATSSDGKPGHPVIFPPDCFAAMRSLTGDQGAKSVLQANAHRLRRIRLADQRAIVDLDTPEDWSRWEATKDVLTF